MKPEWNTPPNGDFAAYVERLSQRMMPPLAPPYDSEHGFDTGMSQAPAPQDAPSGEPGSTSSYGQRSRPNNAIAAGSAVAHNLAKVMGIVWVAALVLLATLGAPVGAVIGVLVVGLWLAYRLRNWALPPGAATWRQWLEQEARKQKQWQQQGRGK
ncbi:MAG: hypothetical protein KJ901_06405 [Gammaproteobacteria bacterium]|nr:hypothetical protein [Gammaproteobacteria bacterium]MBU1439901.1 hypothetical protein [Gammaproteobacteria bacterium]